MIYFTVFAVSLDAYVAGISLGKDGNNALGLLYVSSYSFILPFIALLLASVFPFKEEWLNTLSACILIILGIKGLLPERGNKGLLKPPKPRARGIVRLTLLGVSLSIDSVFGALTAYGVNYAFVVPFYLMASHFTLLALGSITARLLGFAEWLMLLASATLVVIGILRL
ncbi:MAG: hypothetical protein IJX05_02835 [Clostridia bacterium]|nr:hypothetical protein [Clostridia bacterium]